jgi:hypothetical protein
MRPVKYAAPDPSIPENPPARPPVSSPWRAGIAAARANLMPGLVLVAFAVALLLAYFYHRPTHDAMEALGRWRQQIGWPFALVSTALFGGVIPGLVQMARPRLRHTMTGAGLGFLALFWAYKGLEVELLYKLQAGWFGDNRELPTLIRKVAVDQGLYCPLWAVPSTVLAYALKDRGFSVARTLEPMGRLGWLGWYQREVFPVLISNAAVWVPAVCVIYCLPLALQLPVQNLVLCFWSLLLVLQVHPEGARPAVEPSVRGPRPRESW